MDFMEEEHLSIVVLLDTEDSHLKSMSASFVFVTFSRRSATSHQRTTWTMVIVIGMEDTDNSSKGVVTGHTPEETPEMMTYPDNQSPLVSEFSVNKSRFRLTVLKPRSTFF